MRQAIDGQDAEKLVVEANAGLGGSKKEKRVSESLIWTRETCRASRVEASRVASVDSSSS